MKIENEEQLRELEEIASDLIQLKYYPREDAGRLSIIKEIGRMVSDIDQARWLVRRMLSLYNEWPGPMELRGCFCSRFRPADGIERHSTAYAGENGDSFPPEPGKAKSLPAPQALAMPAGSPESADGELAEKVRDAAKGLEMPKTAISPEQRRAEAKFNRVLGAVLTPPRERREAPREPTSAEQIADEERKAGIRTAIAEFHERKRKEAGYVS